MGNSGVYVEGLRETVRNLEKLGVEVEDLKDVFSAIATAADREYTRLIPTRTGRLANAMRPNRAKNKAILRVGSARVPYAGPINYGWPKRNIKPSRFLERGDDSFRPKALEMLETGLGDLFEKYGLTDD